MDEQFIRTRMLLGAPAMERLGKSHVAVLGLGGVGSWCAEALCRSGVGELTLVDQDTVSVSNLNRQAAAVWSTVGMEKTQAAAQRLAGIAPGCLLHPLSLRYEAGTREEFFQARYDYIVDAIDLVSCNLDLIQTAHARAAVHPCQRHVGSGGGWAAAGPGGYSGACGFFFLREKESKRALGRHGAIPNIPSISPAAE